ncbi:MAG: gliding motility protein GldL [Paludibacteraceae bacterium]|nr:gliding motility protein GldL [Paludibacteraceae bacterium]
MATEKKEGGFMHWYHSYQGKNVVNMVYSLGASVVIIGALFKIMHWPGAGIVLTAGMCTEAFLFMIGVLEAPHEEYHWGNVFPQLLEFGSPEDRVEKAHHQAVPTLLGAGAAGAAGAQDKKQAEVPSLAKEDMESLKGGIANLAKTANQLSELGNVAIATNKLGEKAEKAAEAAGKFAASAEALGAKNEELGTAYSSVVAGMQKVVAGTNDYQKNIEGIGQKLGSINSLYELQINALQSQADAYKAHVAQVAAATTHVNAMASNAEKMAAASADALKSQQAYEEASKKLAAQVADLNKVYGNMLSALA